MSRTEKRRRTICRAGLAGDAESAFLYYSAVYLYIRSARRWLSCRHQRHLSSPLMSWQARRHTELRVQPLAVRFLAWRSAKSYAHADRSLRPDQTRPFVAVDRGRTTSIRRQPRLPSLAGPSPDCRRAQLAPCEPRAQPTGGCPPGVLFAPLRGPRSTIMDGSDIDARLEMSGESPEQLRAFVEDMMRRAREGELTDAPSLLRKPKVRTPQRPRFVRFAIAI